jgi:hypothetical protein
MVVSSGEVMEKLPICRNARVSNRWNTKAFEKLIGPIDALNEFGPTAHCMAKGTLHEFSLAYALARLTDLRLSGPARGEKW